MINYLFVFAGEFFLSVARADTDKTQERGRQAVSCSQDLCKKRERAEMSTLQKTRIPMN